MKKTVLTAAFAALALSAAQAVSISWQQESVTGNQTIGSFGDGSVFALTATLTVPGQEGNGKDLFRFGAGTGDSTNYIKVAKNTDANQSGILKFWAKGASGGENSKATSATVGPNNEYSISMVVDQRNSTSTVTLYVDGDNVGELTLGVDLGSPITTLVVNDAMATHGLTLTDASIYTAGAGEDIYDLAQRSSVDGHVVPEPTALALLALGVAGVALRRRAA